MNLKQKIKRLFKRNFRYKCLECKKDPLNDFVKKLSKEPLPKRSIPDLDDFKEGQTIMITRKEIEKEIKSKGKKVTEKEIEKWTKNYFEEAIKKS